MWYYVENGQQRGPVVDADLDTLRREGKINSETLVWRDGMENWLPLSQVQPSLATAAPAVGATTGAGGGVICSECGKVFPVSEVIRYGNVWVCANCKPVFVQKLREGVTVSSGPLEFAGFWTRFAAYFVDSIITGILGAIVGGVIGAVMGAAGAMKGGAAGIIAVQLTAMIVSLGIRAAYFIYFIGKDGQTPGKKMCKIKVVNPDGTQVSYGKATGRFFGYILSSMICGFGYFMAGWDEEKRALHDRLCDTRVIKL
jgi:uncharacterized RDD family membrane protein YckC